MHPKRIQGWGALLVLIAWGLDFNFLAPTLASVGKIDAVIARYTTTNEARWIRLGKSQPIVNETTRFIETRLQKTGPPSREELEAKGILKWVKLTKAAAFYENSMRVHRQMRLVIESVRELRSIERDFWPMLTFNYEVSRNPKGYDWDDILYHNVTRYEEELTEVLGFVKAIEKAGSEQRRRDVYIDWANLFTTSDVRGSEATMLDFGNDLKAAARGRVRLLRLIQAAFFLVGTLAISRAYFKEAELAEASKKSQSWVAPIETPWPGGT